MLGALIRTVSGKEGGRNIRTEVTTRAWHQGLQKLTQASLLFTRVYIDSIREEAKEGGVSDTVWSKPANIPLQLLEDHSKSLRELAEVDDVPDVLKGEVLALLGPLRHRLHAIQEGRGVHVVTQTVV